MATVNDVTSRLDAGGSGGGGPARPPSAPTDTAPRQSAPPARSSAPSSSPSPPRDARRDLPSVGRVADAIRARAGGGGQLPTWAIVTAARQVLAVARATPIANHAQAPPLDELAAQAGRRAELLARSGPARVINATGVVLHTNLGRAPLAAGAARAAAVAARHYSDLELDLSSGRRGNRLAGVRQKLILLSGAEDAHVVNNNAAALVLAVHTLAVGREVIVSRGELIEIGDSFRLQEIATAAGARLVEVGATNCTRPEDYAGAISPATALLLKVHRSNFEQRGFVREVQLEELTALARAHHLPVLEDLGSGLLVDLRDRGWPPESYAPERLRRGADLVCFSGDKLLGGPQAGILLGRAEAVGALRRAPLARALRLDKMSVAALDWTLGALLEGDARAQLPVLRALSEPLETVRERAGRCAERLRQILDNLLPPRPALSVEPSEAPVGGGSVPGFSLPSAAVVLRGARFRAEELGAALRDQPLPVIARVRDGALHLDARTLRDAELAPLARAVGAALHRCALKEKGA